MHSEIHTFHLRQLTRCNLDFASCSLYSKSNFNESAMAPYARTKVPAEPHVCMRPRTIQNYQAVALIPSRNVLEISSLVKVAGIPHTKR
jgi:hypothetical protein